MQVYVLLKEIQERLGVGLVTKCEHENHSLDPWSPASPNRGGLGSLRDPVLKLKVETDKEEHLTDFWSSRAHKHSQAHPTYPSTHTHTHGEENKGSKSARILAVMNSGF